MFDGLAALLSDVLSYRWLALVPAVPIRQWSSTDTRPIATRATARSAPRSAPLPSGRFTSSPTHNAWPVVRCKRTPVECVGGLGTRGTYRFDI